MAGTAQKITYVNTANTPEEVWADAVEFFARALDEDIDGPALTESLEEGSVKVNQDRQGDGKPWRGWFVYSAKEPAF